MRGLSCEVCGAETTNGLALCAICQGALVLLLEFVPIYFRNLSRWRPSSLASDRKSAKSKKLIDEMVAVLDTGRTSGRPSALTIDASSDRVGRLLDETHIEFVGWMDALADDRPELAPVIARILTFDEERTVRLTCALLTKRVATLTTLPWIRDLHHGVTEIERRLRNETERAVPGWYAGACRRCDQATYVVPGLTWVTCQNCSTTTHVAAHLEIILDEARDWIASPTQIAGALVALVDTEQSIPRLFERIVKWGARGRITAVRAQARDHVFDGVQITVATVEVGRARYRFGEVYDRLMIEGATKMPKREDRAHA